ncbi:MAG: beta-lactamase family protein [Planctomycetota bacterium]|nr:MAG: beta-lactamase family protein [Planctomycetota bacterium]
MAVAQPVDLAERLEPIRAKHDLPALAALVTTAEGTVAAGAVGVRKAGDETAVTADDLWHLGSCTKSMAGTVAAILVDRGVISWDATVGEVFGGEFDDIRPGYLGATLEQLMSHRAGVPTGAPPAAWAAARKQRGTVRAAGCVCRAVLAAEPASAPGTKYEYSNQGITIAAAMLERAWDESEGAEGTTWGGVGDGVGVCAAGDHDGGVWGAGGCGGDGSAVGARAGVGAGGGAGWGGVADRAGAALGQSAGDHAGGAGATCRWRTGLGICGSTCGGGWASRSCCRGRRGSICTGTRRWRTGRWVGTGWGGRCTTGPGAGG